MTGAAGRSTCAIRTAPRSPPFAASHRDEVLFHEFLQWVADRSLAAAQARAREAGMRIGLVGDLAVGMDPTGSHAWSRQRDILLGVAIGAPPDLFNPRGQDWGLTGFSPRALEDGGFAPFIATLRAALRHAGGLRIDHAMGLSRLWLVPEGADPAEGAYLTYPLTDLLRLLALESARHNAIVVGEDLGTVPAGFRETLDQDGVHGMRVLWFERGENNSFAAPQTWDAAALAMTTTHDLPTVAGWWSGTDIAARAECGRLGRGRHGGGCGGRARRAIARHCGSASLRRAWRTARRRRPRRRSPWWMRRWPSSPRTPLAAVRWCRSRTCSGRRSNRTCRGRSTSIRTGAAGCPRPPSAAARARHPPGVSPS